jgi:hypothetical protein
VARVAPGLVAAGTACLRCGRADLGGAAPRGLPPGRARLAAYPGNGASLVDPARALAKVLAQLALSLGALAFLRVRARPGSEGPGAPEGRALDGFVKKVLTVTDVADGLKLTDIVDIWGL